jgi:hypothetical protein
MKTSSSVVVNDLDVKGVSVFPDETDAPLIIDPDAVLPRTVAAEPLEAVARGNQKVLERLSAVKDQQLSQCSSLDFRRKPPCPLTEEQSLGLGVAKAPDHPAIITLGVNSVKKSEPG